MEKFISKEKLSKRERRKLNQARRTTWGAISPVTRKTENKKIYNRKKVQRGGDGTLDAEPFCYPRFYKRFA
jgi:hypothetical protein